MKLKEIKKYAERLFSNVFVFSLIDVLFSALYALLIGGVLYIFTLVTGDSSIVTSKNILVASQFFLSVYFVVISITSIIHYVKFKKRFSSNTQDD